MSSSALTLSGLGGYISTLSTSTASSKVWTALGKSLSAGDLSTAESEYTSYEQLASSSTTTALKSDLSTLGTALKEGDLSAAQSSYQDASSDLTASSAAQQISTVRALAEQAANWITSLMGEDSGSSSSSSIDPITALINTVYGESNSTYTDTVSTLLKNKYAALAGNSTSSSSSMDAAISILSSISTYA